MKSRVLILRVKCLYLQRRLVLASLSMMLLAACHYQHSYDQTLDYELESMPYVPKAAPENTVCMGDALRFEEEQLDLPITPGPYEPTWESIEAHYPGTPEWLRNAKFGIWVHFGPQSAGKSGDWYARRLYMQGSQANYNHQKYYGHPSEIGYKDVLHEWNPELLDPNSLAQIYRDAGARFLIVQGVHHDQYDMWDSKYQPWNSINVGPKRDLIREWQEAAHKVGLHFGVTFHHEYSWWWWQTAFKSDVEGDKAGVPYDGNLSLEDGVGTWWDGLDPRMLYGINLLEYKGVSRSSRSNWSPPSPGIFNNHLPYCRWYAKWWALRIMDVVDKYQPDFIYTDGTDQQPFSGFGSGTGYRCDAMQRVIADYYNKTLARKGNVDVFSVVKFRKKTRGTINTQEGVIPPGIINDQDWIAETPVGDWFYAPDFNYSSDAVIRYLLEQVSRDGCVGLSVPLSPKGAMDKGCAIMLKELGEWLKLNGDGIYGSRAWHKLGEGGQERLHVLPSGKIGKEQAEFSFSISDFRFTLGQDGALYAWCMMVPDAGEELLIESLALDSKYLANAIETVELVGHKGSLKWFQDLDGLHISCPADMPFKTAVAFKIGPNTISRPYVPLNIKVLPRNDNVELTWENVQPEASYVIKRSVTRDGPFVTVVEDLKQNTWVDKGLEPGKLYYYSIAATIGSYSSFDSKIVPVLLGRGIKTWNSIDIGQVERLGSYVQVDNTLHIKGAGHDVWGDNDAFNFTYKTLNGDGSIEAKVESMDNTDNWAKVGLMIRETLDNDAPHTFVFLSPHHGVTMQSRSAKAHDMLVNGSNKDLHSPQWLRLERKGDLFTAWYSEDAVYWEKVASTTIHMSPQVKFGMAVCSHQNGEICNAIFGQVTYND